MRLFTRHEWKKSVQKTYLENEFLHGVFFVGVSPKAIGWSKFLLDIPGNERDVFYEGNLIVPFRAHCTFISRVATSVSEKKKKEIISTSTCHWNIHFSVDASSSDNFRNRIVEPFNWRTLPSELRISASYPICVPHLACFLSDVPVFIFGTEVARYTSEIKSPSSV